MLTHLISCILFTNWAAQYCQPFIDGGLDIELRGTTASRPPLPLPPQPHRPQIGGGYSPVFNTAPPIITCRPFNIARFKTNHIITSDTSDLPSEHVNSEFSTWCVSQDSLKQISRVTWLISSKSEKLFSLFFKRCKILLLLFNFPHGTIFQMSLLNACPKRLKVALAALK